MIFKYILSLYTIKQGWQHPKIENERNNKETKQNINEQTDRVSYRADVYWPPIRSKKKKDVINKKLPLMLYISIIFLVLTEIIF